MNGNETFKVYLPEWIVMHIEWADPGLESTPRERCEQYAHDQFHGRVYPQDIRVESEGQGKHEIARVMVYKPNVVAEFKHLSLAEALVEQRGWPDAVVVERNSVEEQKLLQYAVRRLRSDNSGEALPRP